MLMIAKKHYTLTVEIIEGDDEFWEGLRGKVGSDDMVDEVKAALSARGFTAPDCYVRLTKFEERPRSD